MRSVGKFLFGLGCIIFLYASVIGCAFEISQSEVNQAHLVQLENHLRDIKGLGDQHEIVEIVQSTDAAEDRLRKLKSSGHARLIKSPLCACAGLIIALVGTIVWSPVNTKREGGEL